MNRRDILRASASGLPLILSRPFTALAGALNASPVERPNAVTLGPLFPSAFIYDVRHGEARAFATDLSPHVAAMYPTRGDATGLWYGALGALLRQQGGAVAGLTSYSDLVIARSCGRELGLRLVFERNYSCGFDLVAPTSNALDSLASTIVSHCSNEPSHASQLTAWLLKPRWIEVAQEIRTGC